MRALLCFALVAPLAGCNQLKKVDDGGDSGNGDCVPPEVQAVFDASCAIPGCHGMGAAQQGLALDAGQSDSIVGRQASQRPNLSLVEIGNIEGSYLLQKILPDGDFDLDPMPPTGPLAPDQLAIVAGWIAGAPFECAGTATMTDTDDPTTMTDTAADTGSETSGNDPIMPCSLEDVMPGATNPIEAADEAGMIPLEIGDVLLRNCGCHYIGGMSMNGFTAYTGLADMSTHAGFQADLRGMPTYVETLTRLMAVGNPMPPLCTAEACFFGGCNTEENNNITMADSDLLQAWLEADAPDGATWMGQ